MTNKILNNTLAILIIFSAVACGKKITNIFPSSGSNTPGQAIAPPTNNNSGNTGNGGSTINPGGGSSDSGGGDLIATNIAYIHTLFSDEEGFRKWINTQADSFINGYIINYKQSDIATTFLEKLDEKTKSQCSKQIININSAYVSNYKKLYASLEKDMTDHFIQFGDYSTPYTSKFNTANEVSFFSSNLSQQKFGLVEQYEDSISKINCSTQFSSYIQSIRFELKKTASCQLDSHTINPQNKDATFSTQGTKSTICISVEDLAKKMTGQAEAQVIAIVMHELAHSVGFDEVDATKLQEYFVKELEQDFNFMAFSTSYFEYLHKWITLAEIIFDLLKSHENLLTAGNSSPIKKEELKAEKIEKLILALQFISSDPIKLESMSYQHILSNGGIAFKPDSQDGLPVPTSPGFTVHNLMLTLLAYSSQLTQSEQQQPSVALAMQMQHPSQLTQRPLTYSLYFHLISNLIYFSELHLVRSEVLRGIISTYRQLPPPTEEPQTK